MKGSFHKPATGMALVSAVYKCGSGRIKNIYSFHSDPYSAAGPPDHMSGEDVYFIQLVFT